MKDGIDQCCVGFLRLSFTKYDKYDGVLIQVVDVLSPDDSMPSREQNFIAFVGWANAAVIGVTKHCPSSCDKEHSRKNKKINIIFYKIINFNFTINS